MRGRALLALVVACVAVLGGFGVVSVRAQGAPAVKVDSAMFGAIEARAIGPAKMSGRISAVDGVAREPDTIYVGSASGGVWKTTNGGTTFKSIFDKYTQSIGAIAVDQSNPSTVWVGTGESWVRNSVSVGTGVYKSTDGGENWQFVGLPESERIGKIVIDPKNPDTVYVAALGHLWNGNEERGLYKTTDGGKTWERVLFVDKDTGCADVAIDPQEPSIIYASTWQFRRKGWSFSSGGPGGGLHKSTDGGKTWTRLTKGLPEGTLGRIAIAVAPSRPGTVYAVVEAKKSALFRSDDAGATWAAMSSSAEITARPFYFGTLIVDPKDHRKVYKPGFNLAVSRDGGKSFSGSGGSYHGDVHCLWVDPNDTSRLFMGTDGGMYRSSDYGNKWDVIRCLPVSQFYHVSFDMGQPYSVYGGLQDNGSWTGPSRDVNGIENADWHNIGIGDGFYAFADPTDRNTVIVEYQGGKVSRFNRTTYERQAIAPQPKPGEPKYRYNWNSPIEMSPTIAGTMYVGAQFVFRSRDRGTTWERISPDLTTNDPAKLQQEDSGGLTPDNSSAENHCTVFTISESPKDANVVWAGTDDGNVQVTLDGGKTWTNVTGNFTGVPKATWVSSIEASSHDRATAYITFDGHTLGDKKPYVYRTTDLGKTWTALAADPIKGYAHVVREDPVRSDLLFVGTEVGLFVSLDAGRQWVQFSGKLPPVAINDIAIHPRDSDVILATHGRGIYIIDDITPLRNITPAVLESDIALLDSQPSKLRFGSSLQDFPGDDEFTGANPPDVAYITYFLRERHVKGDFKIEVYDSTNKLVTTLPAGKRRGINRVEWPMRLKAPRVPAGAQIEGGSILGPLVAEGTYTVKLIKDGKEIVGKVTLVGDPGLSHSAKDRALQQQTVGKLYQSLERLAYVGAAVKSLRDQIDERGKGLKPDDALMKELGAFSTRLDGFYGTLVATREGRITGEVQLRERLGELYGDVSGFAGRPTPSQLERAGALDAEVTTANATFESISANELREINAKLVARGLAPLAPLGREEFEKRDAGRMSLNEVAAVGRRWFASRILLR